MTTPTIDAGATGTLAAGFTVLHVANDEDVLLRPASANAPDHGRVAVQVRPGTRRTDWLTRDLLAALGVDFTVTGSGRNADENLQLLPVRLVSRHITDVLVTGTQSLTPTMLTDLVLLAAAARTRLWLVTAPPVTDAVTTALGDWCAVETSIADTLTAWPGLLEDGNSADATDSADPTTATDRSESSQPAEPRHLPLVDATTLPATSRRLLPAAEAAWVHRRLAAAVTGATGQLVSTTTSATADPVGITGAVARWLLDRYDSAGTLTQFLCDVRGLQVAGLWRGLLVHASLSAALLRRRELSAQLDHWDHQVLHLQALAHALHELRHEPHPPRPWPPSWPDSAGTAPAHSWLRTPERSAARSSPRPDRGVTWPGSRRPG